METAYLALQLAILTRYLVQRRKVDPKYNIWEWKILIFCNASRDFDPKHSIAPAKMTKNLTYVSGNLDIALKPAILYLAIYDLLVISTKYLTVALARLKWRSQNVNYVPINPLTTHNFDLDFERPISQPEILPAHRHLFFIVLAISSLRKAKSWKIKKGKENTKLSSNFY